MYTIYASYLYRKMAKAVKQLFNQISGETDLIYFNDI